MLENDRDQLYWLPGIVALKKILKYLNPNYYFANPFWTR